MDYGEYRDDGDNSVSFFPRAFFSGISNIIFSTKRLVQSNNGLCAGEIPLAGNVRVRDTEYVADVRRVCGWVFPACVDSAEWHWACFWDSGCCCLCCYCFDHCACFDKGEMEGTGMGRGC